MNKFQFWQRWLFGCSLIIIGFGLYMALLNRSPLFEIFNQQVKAVFWPAGSGTAEAQNFQSWIYGVLGATMAGWGVFFAFIAHYPFKAKEAWSWPCLISGVSLWYLVDTSISLYHNFVFNAIFNTIFVVALLLPVILTLKEMRRDNSVSLVKGGRQI
jgi:hypothetical protein